MELQWPLILFTSLLAASAGLFATQSIFALIGKGQKAQMASLIASAALLIVGGISVFFHLEHWERIFNGFGHLSSGITQELICVVLLAIVMVVYFAIVRKGSPIPKWCAIASILISIALVVVMGLSYMMPARPAWNNIFQILSLLGAAAGFGTGCFALIESRFENNAEDGLFAICGNAANTIFTIGLIAMMSASQGSFTDVGNYFDPNHPTYAMISAAEYGPFSAATMPFSIASIVLAIAGLGFALYGKQSKAWSVAGTGIALCAVVSALMLRAAFFACGGSMLMLF